MTLDSIADLADRLRWLPVDGSDPTGVPAPVAEVLTPVRRYVRTLPKHTPLNRVEYELLAALAWSGWSLRAALTEAVNYHKYLDRRSGTYKLAWQHLAQAGLWACVLVRAGGRRLAMVRLTDHGRTRLAQVGVTAVAAEWDLIAARHSGGASGQLQHTGALCAFLYHARRHGYTGEPCPILAHAGRAQPDVLIENAIQQLYVEVQGRGGESWRRRQKWINQMALQECVALCADTPAAAARLAREAQLAGVPLGYATDLTSLATGATAGLWTLRWRSAYMPLERLDQQEA
ncbi:MAG: hypothetical protein NT169_21335 [Chloroflexi bacterium]|nr:hypothetical protein [Chloroflexota bacterium]